MGQYRPRLTDGEIFTLRYAIAGQIGQETAKISRSSSIHQASDYVSEVRSLAALYAKLRAAQGQRAAGYDRAAFWIGHAENILSHVKGKLTA